MRKRQLQVQPTAWFGWTGFQRYASRCLCPTRTAMPATGSTAQSWGQCCHQRKSNRWCIPRCPVQPATTGVIVRSRSNLITLLKIFHSTPIWRLWRLRTGSSSQCFWLWLSNTDLCRDVPWSLMKSCVFTRYGFHLKTWSSKILQWIHVLW